MNVEDLSIIWPDDLIPGQLVRLRMDDGSQELLMVVGKVLDFSGRIETRYTFVPVPFSSRDGDELTTFRRQALAQHGWLSGKA